MTLVTTIVRARAPGRPRCRCCTELHSARLARRRGPVRRLPSGARQRTWACALPSTFTEGRFASPPDFRHDDDSQAARDRAWLAARAEPGARARGRMGVFVPKTDGGWWFVPGSSWSPGDPSSSRAQSRWRRRSEGLSIHQRKRGDRGFLTRERTRTLACTVHASLPRNFVRFGGEVLARAAYQPRREDHERDRRREEAARPSTMRPPRAASVPRPGPSPTVPRVATSNDRPTPRSTVIPRIRLRRSVRDRRRSSFHGAHPDPSGHADEDLVADRDAPPSLTGPLTTSRAPSCSTTRTSSTPSRHAVRRARDRADRIAPSIVIPEHRREMRVIAAISVALDRPARVRGLPLRRPFAPYPHDTDDDSGAGARDARSSPDADAGNVRRQRGRGSISSRAGARRRRRDGARRPRAFAALSSTKKWHGVELDARTLDVARSTAEVISTRTLVTCCPRAGRRRAHRGGDRRARSADVRDAEGDAASARGTGSRRGDRGMEARGARLWRLPWPETIDAWCHLLGSSGERAGSSARGGDLDRLAPRGGRPTSALAKLSTSRYAGSPTLDAQGDEAIVAWAEREESTPWGIRWTRWTSKRARRGPRARAPPRRPGDRAMAPSVAALGDRRFSWRGPKRGAGQRGASRGDRRDRPRDGGAARRLTG